MGIARGVGAQYEDYCERAKLEATTGSQPKGEARLAVDRRAAYMAKAYSRKFAKLNKKGELIPTRPVLAAIDLFDRLERCTIERDDGTVSNVAGSALYRVYSAYAHGMQWANMLGDMRAVATADRHGHSVAAVVASDSVLAGAFVRPVRAIRRALDGLGTHREATA